MRIKLAVCTNDEVVGNYGEWCADAIQAWSDTVLAWCHTSTLIADYDQVADYRAWNGGRFHGGPARFGEVYIERVELDPPDEDTEPEWVQFAALPTRAQEYLAVQVWDRLTEAGRARAEAQRQHEAEEAALADD